MIEILRTRRSIRKYEKRPIDEKSLETLKEAARIAVDQAGRDFAQALGQEKKSSGPECDCDSGLAEPLLALGQYRHFRSSNHGLFFRQSSSPVVWVRWQ
jgi:nitroreductase